MRSLAPERGRSTPTTITCKWYHLSICSTSMYGQLLVLSYQCIRNHVLIMIFLSSSCQMYQGILWNEDGTVRQRSTSRLQLVSRTIFSAQLGAKRSRFGFWARIKWGILTGWLWKRNSKKNINQETIAGPRVQRDYVKYINAVDKNNHYSSFYLGTICKICYYLRIFYWALDRVVYTLFVVICHLSKAGIGKSEWQEE